MLTGQRAQLAIESREDDTPARAAVARDVGWGYFELERYACVDVAAPKYIAAQVCELRDIALVLYFMGTLQRDKTQNCRCNAGTYARLSHSNYEKQ